MDQHDTDDDEDFDHIRTWDLLDITLINQESDYRKRFGLDNPEPIEKDAAKQWRLARQLDRLAPELVKSVAGLTISSEAADLARALAPGDRPRHSVRDLIGYNVVRERLAIELAADAIRRLHDAEKRFLPLIPFLRDHALGPTAAAYVDRVIRLYFSGFGPECVAMCRSALDAALTSVIDDERAGDALKRRSRSRHGFMLADRIEAAVKFGLFTDQDKTAAHRIREWGRDAIHFSPGLAPEPAAAIFTLIVLLEKLFPDGSE